MKAITTHAGTYVTGDEIAAAVLRLHATLVNARRAELVDIPIAAGDGGPRWASFVVGWPYPLSATTVDLEIGDGEELIEPQAVIEVYERLSGVGVVRGAAFSAGEADDWPEFDLDFRPH